MVVIPFSNKKNSYNKSLSKELDVPEHMISIVEWYNSSVITLTNIVNTEDSAERIERCKAVIAILAKLLASAQVGLNIKEGVTTEVEVAKFFLNESDSILQDYLDGNSVDFNL